MRNALYFAGDGGEEEGRLAIVVSEWGTKSTNERFNNRTRKLRIHFHFVFRLQSTDDNLADAFFEIQCALHGG